MNRQYLYVVVAFVLVIVLAYAFGVLGGVTPVPPPGAPSLAVGMKTLA